MKRVVTIILNHNGLSALGAKLLSRCLKSVLETDYEDFIVLFVDNASNDGTIDFIKKKFSEYIGKGFLHVLQLDRNYRWSGGNNRGAVYALKRFNPDYIVFLNNDLCVISRSWLKTTLEIMENHNVHIASPLIYEVARQRYNIGNIIFSNGRSVPIELTEKDLQRILLKGTRVLELPAIHGAAMIVSSKVFRELKGFDEGFRAYYDETDFCFRARRKDYRVAAIIDPNTKVLHFGSLTIKKQKHIYNRKVMYIVESSIRFTYKHYGSKSLISCILLTLKWLIAEIYKLNLSNMLGIALGLVNGISRSI